MSAFSELRDAKSEHDEMRVHLSPEQNKELDASFASGNRWIRVGYGLFGIMLICLAALAM